MSEAEKKERWKPIKGEWGQLYAVSNLGRVKSLERIIKGWKKPVVKQERIITPIIHKSSGFLCFRAWSEGKAKVFFIHRVVAVNFVKKSKLLNVVGFKDGDLKNCTAKNLYWTTAGELIKKSMVKEE